MNNTKKNIVFAVSAFIIAIFATSLVILSFNNERDWKEIANEYRTYEEEKSQMCLLPEVLAERFIELMK